MLYYNAAPVFFSLEILPQFQWEIYPHQSLPDDHLQCHPPASRLLHPPSHPRKSIWFEKKIFFTVWNTSGIWQQFKLSVLLGLIWTYFYCTKYNWDRAHIQKLRPPQATIVSCVKNSGDFIISVQKRVAECLMFFIHPLVWLSVHLFLLALLFYICSSAELIIFSHENTQSYTQYALLTWTV